MDEDKLISMFADMARGSAEGTGKLLLERKVDIKYILNRMIFSIIIIVVNLFMFKISIVFFVISLIVSFFTLFICWGDIYDFWSHKTRVRVYENGIELSNSINNKKYISYYEITNVELQPDHCIYVVAHYFEGYVHYLEDENEVYNLILERIKVKTGRVKAD